MHNFDTVDLYDKAPSPRCVILTGPCMPPLAALFFWPVISLAVFSRVKLPLALLITVIVGYLFLPEGIEFNPPLLPTFDKYTIPALAAALVTASMVGGRQKHSGQIWMPGWLPKLKSLNLLLVFLLFATGMTALTNEDTVRVGERILQALRPYDAFSNILSIVMAILPLLLARKFLAYPNTHRLLLAFLCSTGVVYSFLALLEVRLSPQLNYWLYGFFPHSWAQHVRDGGFRPVVFLEHGLRVGIFFSATILASLALTRIHKAKFTSYLLAACWLLGTLLLSKNLGALLITITLLPAVMFLSVRGQLWIAAMIAILFVTYPMMRSANLIPTQTLIEVAEDFDPQRARSLSTRIDNEEAMLARAAERPLFGWGGWGRSRLYNDAGVDVTTADGSWVITLGVGGWGRFLATFGLMAAPICLLLVARRRYNIGLETSALAVILAGNMMDLIPNSSVTPITWILVGALWGRLELGRQEGQPITERRPGRESHPRDRGSLDEEAEVLAQNPTLKSDVVERRYTRQTNRIERPNRKIK